MQCTLLKNGNWAHVSKLNLVGLLAPMESHIYYQETISTAKLASYPGLLAPAFVACSTNAGEGLVKLSHVV